MPISRKKSCIPCRAAKARCNRAHNCLRCVERGLGCDYENISSRSIADPRHTAQAFVSGDLSPRNPGQDLTTAPLGFTASSYELQTDLTSALFQIEDGMAMDFMDSATLEPGLDLATTQRGIPLGGDQFASSTRALWPDCPQAERLPLEDASDMVLPEYFDEDASPEMQELADQPDRRITNLSGPVSNHLPSRLHNGRLHECIAGFYSIFSTTGAPPNQLAVPRHGVRRQAKGLTSKSLLMTQVLLGRIGDFPQMLLGEQLPPFIYPTCALESKRPGSCGRDGIHACLPEPLAICAATVQLSLSRNQQNSAFISRVIAEEQQTLLKNIDSYDSMALLAATQACIIYVLLQAQTASTTLWNEVGYMMTGLDELTVRLHESNDYRSDIYSLETMTKQDWVLYESTRRVMDLLFLLERLLGVMIGRRDDPACLGFRTAPLPCPRELWDRATKVSWAHQLDRYVQSRPDRSVLIIRDLFTACKSEAGVDASKRADQNFEKVAGWCRNHDDFGNLVWMATLLET